MRNGCGLRKKRWRNSSARTSIACPAPRAIISSACRRQRKTWKPPGRSCGWHNRVCGLWICSCAATFQRRVHPIQAAFRVACGKIRPDLTICACAIPKNHPDVIAQRELVEQLKRRWEEAACPDCGRQPGELFGQSRHSGAADLQERDPGGNCDPGGDTEPSQHARADAAVFH